MKFYSLPFFCLVGSLLLACAAALSMTPTVLSAAPALAGTIPYLALGDSYTIGEGATHAERWPVQLAALARAQGLPLAAPDIIARTGWTTAELLDAIEASGNQRTDYGLVSLLIGVNNQYRGQPVARYRAELRELLARATRFAGGRPGRVLVLSIPDWGQAPFAEGRDRVRIGQEINEFNAVAQVECQRAGIQFVDITPLTRQAEGEFVADGLHYAGSQMRRWVELALPAARQLLTKNDAGGQ